MSVVYSSKLQCAKNRRRHFALGPRQVDGQLLHSACVSGHNWTGENGFGRHGRQVRQQRVEQQEEKTPDDFHQRAAGGAGESLSENPLSRCLCEGTAGHEDGINRGQSAGTVYHRALSLSLSLSLSFSFSLF